MMRKLGLLVVAFGLLVAGCDYRTKHNYITRRNVEEYLQRLEKGYSFNANPITYSRELSDLKEYLTARKEKLYHNKPEDLYRFHLALISLFQADLFNAFEELLDLVDDPRFRAKILYHVGTIISDQQFRSSDEILGLAALATRETFPAPLDLDQHVSILIFSSDYPLLQMYPYLTEDLLDRHELEGYNYRSRIRRALDMSRIEMMDIRKRFLEDRVTEEFIENLFRKYGDAEFLRDYAVAFYIHPYHQDFIKAKAYADRVDYRKWIEIYPHDRVTMLMRAYIGAGDYQKAINIYAYHKARFDESSQSLSQTNLLLGAAYAGLGDLDSSFDYVSKEFAITEIKENPSSSAAMTVEFPAKGDILVSLYELFFVFDEYQKYKGTQWYGYLEEMVNRNLARYKHLRIFNK
jgi:hypothetical protein